MDEQKEQGTVSVVSPLFTLICVSVTTMGLLLLSWLHLQVFTPRDASYQLYPLSTQVINKEAGAPAIVETGFLLERFNTFEVTTNRFSCEGILWFRFDPTLISLETIEGIVVDNGKFVERTKVHTQQMGGRLFVQYAVRIELEVNMNYSAFPTDDHRLYIALMHPEASPGIFVFESARTDFVIQEDMALHGWLEHDRRVATGYVETRIALSSLNVEQRHPAVYFGMDFRRTSMRDLITILLPLLVLYFVSLCVFSANRMRYWPERMNMILQSIVGFIAFRFVMETISPKVAYFMRADYLFLLFLGISSLLFVVNFLAQQMSVFQEKLLLMFCSALVIVSYYVFIVYW